MTKLGLFLVVAMLAIALVGCGPKGPTSEDLIGSWTQTVVLDPDDDVANQIKSAIADAASMELRIRDDKTFTLTVAGSASIGTWEFKENQLTLTYTDVQGLVLGNGVNAALTISDDLATLETRASSSGSTTVFKRS